MLSSTSDSERDAASGLLRPAPALRTGAPALSVVIAAYNVAPYIRAAVESALDQTLRDLEVVVVDDGSTDETPAVLAGIAAERRDSRLRIVRQPNGGLSAARNTGIREARAALVGFLDGDDVWLPSAAEKHVAAMNADPALSVSFTRCEYLTDDGRRTGRFLVTDRPEPTLDDMIRRNHVGAGNAVVRKRCFEVAGCFREDLRSLEDWEMWCRILTHGGKVKEIPEPLLLYRMRSTSLSHNTAGFTENADRAVAIVSSEHPDKPARMFRASLAEHYRIAAYKALQHGDARTALKVVARAIRLHPRLVADRRAAGTLALALLPRSLRALVARHGPAAFAGLSDFTPGDGDRLTNRR